MIEFSLKTARILIVDDQVANVSLLQNILNRIGYSNLRGVTDSREVLGQLEQFRPDLIILDLHMPHFDGFEVLKQVGGVIPREDFLPVLVVTADATAPTKRKALGSGASDLLHKPFDISEIFMRIRNLLQTRFLHVQMEQKVADRTQELEEAVAELKDTQRQVVQQERLRAFGEMAGGVVHDFNNALMSVIGYSELLLQDPELLRDHGMVLDYLKTMNTAGRDAAHVISRLRDFYRPREETDVFLSTNVNELIEVVVPMTQPKWKDQALVEGRVVKVELDLQKLPPVSAIAAELREVLTNLIFNAVDAMPEGGTITLSTRREEDDVIVEVADTGTGMTEEVRNRCLEPFFSTKGDKGTGLGLAMVFGVIKRHEGTFEIDSQPGKGTTLRIRLPSQIKTFEADTSQRLPITRSLRVLVLDDEAISRDVVSKYLESDGHDVTTATNGYEAMEKLKSTRFDLLLTDHSMPGMNGVQFAEAVRAAGATQPILMVTGFSDPALAPDEMPSGVDLLLSKPIPQANLRKAIAQLVG